MFTFIPESLCASQAAEKLYILVSFEISFVCNKRAIRVVCISCNLGKAGRSFYSAPFSFFFLTKNSAIEFYLQPTFVFLYKCCIFKQKAF